MRTREEIEYNSKHSDTDEARTYWRAVAVLEVLLDIRDLLNPND